MILLTSTGIASAFQATGLLAGLVIMIVWLSFRARGKELLPEGPAPRAEFTFVDVIAVLFLWLGVQVMAVAVMESIGFSPGVNMVLFGKLAETAVALFAVWAWISRSPRHGPRAKGAVAGLAACLGFLPVAWAVLAGTQEIYRAAGRSFSQQKILTQLEGAASWKFVVLAVVLAPLTEEILFRGMLYAGVKRYTGPWIAAIVSALLFTAAHQSLAQGPAIFVLALALVYVYERTGTLVSCIVFHSCFNAFTVLAQLLLKGG